MALRLSSHSLLHGRVRSLKISGKYNWTVLIGFVAMESFHLKVSLDLWLLEKNATFDIFTILQIRGRESLLRWSSSKAKVQPRPRGSCGDFFSSEITVYTNFFEYTLFAARLVRGWSGNQMNLAQVQTPTRLPLSSLRLLSNLTRHADVAIFRMHSEVLRLAKLLLDDNTP